MIDLQPVVLVTVDNDPEARLINLLAKAAGICVIRSEQLHGGTLDEEPDILERIRKTGKTEVWTMELPGPAIEKQLRNMGYIVRIIDHHVYHGDLDRAHDPQLGKRLRSSLEQFLVWATITDSKMISWGFEPKLVVGIGIFDDRFVQGLQKASYTEAEIAEVLAYDAFLGRQVFPHFDEVQIEAQRAWNERTQVHGYNVFKTYLDVSVSRAISLTAIKYGAQSVTSVTSDRNGRQIFVNNISYATVQLLEHAFTNRHTFTYGSGRCFGIDNDKCELQSITLDEVLAVLIPSSN